MSVRADHFANRMAWWASQGDLGYDQWNRWDLREGGEVDCSSMVIQVAKECGLPTGGATYTGNMRNAFSSVGWTVLPPGVELMRGDVLLNDVHHTAVYVGDGYVAQASIDENGDIRGGMAGDQIDYETNVKPYYDYPWDCILRWEGDIVVSQDIPVDGNCGPATVGLWQHIMGTTVDRCISGQNRFIIALWPACDVMTTEGGGSLLIASVQVALGLEADGYAGYDTIHGIQDRLGIRRRDIFDRDCVMALQGRLSQGVF